MIKPIYASSVNSVYKLINLLNEQNVKSIAPQAVYSVELKRYQNLFFHYIEKSKASVLSSTVAECGAKSYSRIPETMLYQEKELKELITSYTQELAANPDSAMIDFYQNELISANHDYEDFTYSFQYDYPRYYDLKYGMKVPSIEDIQEHLDESTTLLTYFVTKNSIYLTQVENDLVKIHKSPKNGNYDRSIKAFKKGIFDKNKERNTKNAYALYKALFPLEISESVKNLIIIQDGAMSNIPFEALLTSKVSVDNIDYSTLPYLIKSYNISYALSADLYHQYVL